MLLEHPRRTASPASSALALGAALLLFAAAGASQRFAAPASARLTATSCDAITREGECKSAASCEWRAADATCLAFAQGFLPRSRCNSLSTMCQIKHLRP